MNNKVNLNDPEREKLPTAEEVIDKEMFGTKGREALVDLRNLRELPLTERIALLESFEILPDSDVIRPIYKSIADKAWTPIERVIGFCELFSDTMPLLGYVEAKGVAPALIMSWCLPEDVPDTDWRVMSNDRTVYGHLKCLSYKFHNNTNVRPVNISIGQPLLINEDSQYTEYLGKFLSSAQTFSQVHDQ